jgi:hypothetical protein
MFFSGGLGAVCVVMSWVVIPRIIGFGLYFIMFNFGQLATSLAFDTVGFSKSMDKIEATPLRISGKGLLNNHRLPTPLSVQTSNSFGRTPNLVAALSCTIGVKHSSNLSALALHAR